MQPVDANCLARPEIKQVGLWRVRRLWMVLVAILLSAGAVTGGYLEAQAQAPRSFRIPRLLQPDVEGAQALPELPPVEVRKLIVDTDPGVDDAAALIWLLSQGDYPVEPLGIVTVAGNTSLENATKNAQLILSWLQRSDVPVIPGASKPQRVKLSSTTLLIHGPDGLWGLGAPNWGSLPELPTRGRSPVLATKFYCETLRGQESQILVLALGPLTNLARAMSEGRDNGCGVDWTQVQIVSLGGARWGGNQTPVTEYNYWQDPEAAQRVLASGANVTMVTLDAFSQFMLDTTLLDKLALEGNTAIKALLPALQAYYFALSGGGVEPALGDPVAAIVALDQTLRMDGQLGLVHVLGSNEAPEFARGQTVIALGPIEWLTLAPDEVLSRVAESVFQDPTYDLNAALAAILAELMQTTPKAWVMTAINAEQVEDRFLRGVTGPQTGVDAPATPTAGDTSTLGSLDGAGQDDSLDEHQLFLPGIQIGPPGE